MAQIRLHQMGGETVAEFTSDGVLLRTEADARDLILAAYKERASWVALHVANVNPRFFDLKSGLAGDVLQKFVNWKCKLAIVGDISPYIEKSESFAALVRESNRGRDVRFASDLDNVKYNL